jgi:hypothetical protein
MGRCWVGDCGVDHRDLAREARAGSSISVAYCKRGGKLGASEDGPKGLPPALASAVASDGALRHGGSSMVELWKWA